MRVKYVGHPGDPDNVRIFGIEFERKGDFVNVPDNHPKAQKFVNNPAFQVEGAPEHLKIAPVYTVDQFDVSERSPGRPAAAPARAAIAPNAAQAAVPPEVPPTLAPGSVPPKLDAPPAPPAG